MFNNRSKALFVCALISAIYVIYLISYFGTAMGNLDSSEEIGGAIATALVTPHIIVMGLGSLFSWIGFFFKKAWAALVGAILYCLGTLLFIMYFIFCIPIIIFGFIGYAKQKNLTK